MKVGDVVRMVKAMEDRGGPPDHGTVGDVGVIVEFCEVDRRGNQWITVQWFANPGKEDDMVLEELELCDAP